MPRRGTALCALLTITLGLCGGTARSADDPCLCRDLIVTCTVKPAAVVQGDPFEFCATVESVGAVTLEGIRLTIEGCEEAPCVDEGRLSIVIPRLARGEKHTHCLRFTCNRIGACRLLAHAVDSTGIAAATCLCTAVCRGLPALQVRMVDTALDRAPQGIFRLGEEFLYRLSVENDVGSALTPDLRVTWALPPELEFVRGIADRGATVQGSGQSASSSVFVLRPQEIVTFEVVCRVRAVPPHTLVQARAAVITDPSGIELAIETESTTLRP